MKISFKPKLPAAKDLALIKINSQNETTVTTSRSGQKVINFGIGKPEAINNRKLVLIARRIITTAKANRVKRVAINFKEFSLPKLTLTDSEVAEVMAVNFEMANFEFVKYKTAPAGGWNFIQEIVIVGKIAPEVLANFAKGQIIGQQVNATRSLANSPGGDLTPQTLANEAKIESKGLKIKVSVFGPTELKRLKMGGILGVAQGSVEPPRFIIMEYYGAETDQRPIVLVGKGVTFDTGGINLKPTEHINEMQMDMSGGAAVIHAVVTAAKLGIKKNVVGLIPAVENMPSGSSYRPGDILTSMAGKTIEVLNTDAEGRIVLADGLTYAKKFNPRLVVDVATLTGAAMVALGTRAAAIFTKDKNLETLLQDLGESSGDYVWPLPLWDEYEDEIKGGFADWANIGKGRWGGAIHAAIFLYQWAKDYPWVHIDMAPRMTAAEGEYLAKGAVGSPVRLLVKILEQY